jgi:hypothetical protein
MEFVSTLKESPGLLAEKQIADFLVEHVEDDDFKALEWASADEALAYCTDLYSVRFRDEALAEKVQAGVRAILRQVLNRLDEKEEKEAVLQLLHAAPVHPTVKDVELQRLYFQAYTHELGRVRRNRRWLYIYLAIHVLLVLIVFPLLFINAENGAIQQEVEQLANVEVGDEGYRLISYADGLYWSIITATSIGYGDMTPLTTAGKIIAVTLGTMGVITVGIIAGLVLDLITPRRIE